MYYFTRDGGWQAGRKFAVDMAGFAVNVRVLHASPQATIPTRLSYLEDGFLKQLRLELVDLEPLASGCTQVSSPLFSRVWLYKSKSVVLRVRLYTGEFRDCPWGKYTDESMHAGKPNCREVSPTTHR